MVISSVGGILFYAALWCWDLSAPAMREEFFLCYTIIFKKLGGRYFSFLAYNALYRRGSWLKPCAFAHQTKSTVGHNHVCLFKI